MKTLALANGDLVVTPTGHRTISGSAKIRQDLALALGEPLGDDRFHRSWGSMLLSYIGQPIDTTTNALIRAEVSRVLAQYVSVRDEYILADQQTGSRSRFDTSDVVSEVLGISATQEFDTIKVQVSLRTLAGTTITVNRTVTS
jgi:phage baseplate assembly protein W